MERETGFEPATSTLARSHSTTELFPPTRCRPPSVANGSAPGKPNVRRGLALSLLKSRARAALGRPPRAAPG